MRTRTILSLAIALTAVAAIPALADAPGDEQVANCADLAAATPMSAVAAPASQGAVNQSWQNFLDGGIGAEAEAVCSCSGTCGLFGGCACTSCGDGCSLSDCEACCDQGCEKHCTAE